ncbi:MAG: hypothetical protein RJA36_3852 [Pseudomonadota bacterium]|jgi:cytoskeletal protein CcmA (bactofilin family)
MIQHVKTAESAAALPAPEEPARASAAVVSLLRPFAPEPGSSAAPAATQASIHGPAPAMPQLAAAASDGTPPDPTAATDPAGKVDMVVGRGVAIQAAVVVPGSIVIEGCIDGSLKAEHVLLTKTGSIRGSLECKTALVRGRIHGSVDCSGQLLVTATGRIEGEVRNGRTLVIEPCGVVSGRIGKPAPSASPQPEKIRQAAHAPAQQRHGVTADQLKELSRSVLDRMMDTVGLHRRQ